ncbi:MAG: hypothetical protein ACJ760_11725 [Thermoleophilaceae bacterium]
MLTTRIRRTATALFAAAAVAVAAMAFTAPAGAATKATTTGDSTLDAFCTGVAGLINHAMDEGNAASAHGDADSATAWYALAEYMARDANDKGCHFVQARHAGATGGKVVTPTKLLATGRIKSDPTGDSDLDSYCSEIADDVNAALANESTERAAGHTAKADAWREYANRMIAAGRSRGCEFVKARHIRTGLGHVQITTSVQTPVETGHPQIDTSSRLTTGQVEILVRP